MNRREKNQVINVHVYRIIDTCSLTTVNYVAFFSIANAIDRVSVSLDNLFNHITVGKSDL